MLLEEIQEQVVNGYHCKAKTSSFRFYCGSFSHFKIADVPSIEVVEELSPNRCRHLARTGTYTTDDGSRFPIKMGSETIIQLVPVGTLSDSGNVHCEGESRKLKSGMVDSLLVVEQVRLVVEEEKYLIKGQQVERLSNHAVLPCRSTDLSCTTESGTAVWSKPPDCPLARIRSFSATSRGSWLIDEDHQLIVNKSSLAPPFPGCPPSVLYTTNYPQIFIGHHGSFAALPARGVNPLIDTASRIDWSGYQAEQRLLKSRRHFKNQICEAAAAAQQQQDELFPLPALGAHTYGIHAGAVIYAVNCQPTIVSVEDVDRCYTRVRVRRNDQTLAWVDPQTNLLSDHATPIPCNSRFPTVVKTIQGWISLSPSAHPIPEPQQFPKSPLANLDHLSVGRGGVYTPEELDSWSNLISFPVEKKERAASLALTTCSDNGGTCNNRYTIAAGQQYNLDGLESSVTTLLTPWHNFKKFIEDHTAWLSLAVIIGWTLQFIICLCVVTSAYFSHGMTLALALLANICCMPVMAARRLRERQEKLLQRQAATDATLSPEEVPLRHLSQWNAVPATGKGGFVVGGANKP